MGRLVSIDSYNFMSIYMGSTPVQHRVLKVKALEGAFNQVRP